MLSVYHSHMMTLLFTQKFIVFLLQYSYCIVKLLEANGLGVHTCYWTNKETFKEVGRGMMGVTMDNGLPLVSEL